MKCARCAALLVSAVLVVLAPLSAQAGAGVGQKAPGAAPAPATQAGIDLLRQASEAWRGGNFRGRFVYVRGNRLDSMQVVHAVIDGVEHERLSHLDNTATEIIRRGDETICIHPDARMTRLEAAGSGGPFHPFASLDASVAQYYTINRSGQSRVAGRSADFVDVGPRDAHRYGYRLWVDRETRLPLRYEVVNRKGAALESVEFVDIETGIGVPREMFDAPTGNAQTLKLVRSQDAATPAVVPSWLPPGFRVTGTQVQRQGDTESSAVTYSDGLASFSFFVEKADTDAKPMGRQIGPTVAVSGVLSAGNAGRFRVTLVGEVPAGTAVKVVESARHHTHPAGTQSAVSPSTVLHAE